MRLGMLCPQDIQGNKSIRDALIYEENFFRSRPVSVPNTGHHGLASGGGYLCVF